MAEVLSHMADAEIALAFRIRKIAAEPREALVAWDQDRWADGGGYRRTPPREALATFVALRRSNLAYVGRLRAARSGSTGGTRSTAGSRSRSSSTTGPSTT